MPYFREEFRPIGKSFRFARSHALTHARSKGNFPGWPFRLQKLCAHPSPAMSLVKTRMFCKIACHSRTFWPFRKCIRERHVIYRGFRLSFFLVFSQCFCTFFGRIFSRFLQFAVFFECFVREVYAFLDAIVIAAWFHLFCSCMRASFGADIFMCFL